jgi:hypothetical protein
MAQALLQAPRKATRTVALQVKHFPEKQSVYGPEPSFAPKARRLVREFLLR